MLKFTADTSTLPLEELFHGWRRGDLTETQMVGHLLQHIMPQDKRILRLEQPTANESSGRPLGPSSGASRKPSVK